MYANNQGESVALIQYHLGGDGYDQPWGYTRADFYGASTIPQVWFDGVIHASSLSYSALTSYHNTRRSVPTDVTISLAGVQVSGRTYTVAARVCVEDGGTAKDMRIYIVDALDHWGWSSDYTRPRNGFKQEILIEDITVVPGQCRNIVANVTFDTTSWANQEDIRIMAWAQAPADSSPAEVYQAAVMTMPFSPMTADFDMDGWVELDDYVQFEACMFGPGATPTPTSPLTAERCLGTFDLDADDDVDLVDYAAFVPQFLTPRTIYVDATASGANDGTSWANAFTELNDGLFDATHVDEVWVAGGVYTPAGPGGDRAASFRVPVGAKVLGGFAGGETSASQRDFAANPTILSGDLNGNDAANFVNRTDNSYHVVVANGADSSTVLDGFVIEGGNSDSAAPYNRGAGILAESGSVRIYNCVIRDNRAKNGAGMFSVGSSPLLVNCVLAGNDAYSAAGGAMNNDDCTTTLVNCTVADNHASSTGAGINAKGGSVMTLANCVLWGNSGGSGSTEGDQLYLAGATSGVNYSRLEGWTGAFGGTGNNGLSPLFVGGGDYHVSFGSSCIDAGDNDAVAADISDMDGDGDVAEAIPVDLDASDRFADDPATADSGNGTSPIVDIGAYEY